MEVSQSEKKSSCESFSINNGHAMIDEVNFYLYYEECEENKGDEKYNFRLQ